MPQLNLYTIDSFAPSTSSKSIDLFTLYNPQQNGVCQITNYGARIVAMLVPAKDGQFVEVIKGFPKLDAYQNELETFTGAVLGRCVNRIAAGIFVLDGKTYALDTNSEQNTLHGGPNGLHAQVWRVIKVTPHMLVLQFLQMEEVDGFPGNLDVEVIYEWLENGLFQITYHASTDKATPVSLSNHVVFNLSGKMGNQEMLINAKGVIEIDERGIPSGKILETENTALDFKKRPLNIAKALAQNHPQLSIRKGLDHVFVLEKSEPSVLLHSPSSGITLAIQTDRPGMYVGASKAERLSESSGSDLTEDIVFSPQGYPDALHHPYFPSIVLRPGEVYFSITTYHFSIT